MLLGILFRHFGGAFYVLGMDYYFFFSSRRRHTRYWRDWSSDVCSSDLPPKNVAISSATIVDAAGGAWLVLPRTRVGVVRGILPQLMSRGPQSLDPCNDYRDRKSVV